MEAVPTPAIPPKPSEGPVRTARMPGEDRRRQLLRVAIESFAQNGFSGTKTKDIAAAAGVSEAILFRHFASKEDLYHAILDEKEATMGGERWFVEMNELAERRDDRGLFQHVARQLIRSFREDAAFHRLLLYASLEGHLLADLFHERFGLPMGDFLTRYIALRQKEGAFQECEPGRCSNVCDRIDDPLRHGPARSGRQEFPAQRRSDCRPVRGPSSGRPGTAARRRPYSKRKAEVISWQAVPHHNPC